VWNTFHLSSLWGQLPESGYHLKAAVSPGKVETRVLVPKPKFQGFHMLGLTTIPNTLNKETSNGEGLGHTSGRGKVSLSASHWDIGIRFGFSRK
jgi:hypothetical protein